MQVARGLLMQAARHTPRVAGRPRHWASSERRCLPHAVTYQPLRLQRHPLAVYSQLPLQRMSLSSAPSSAPLPTPSQPPPLMPVPPQDGDKQDDVRTGEGDKSSAASSHHKHSSMLEKTLLTLEERELEEQRNLNYSMLVDDEEAPQAGNKPPLLQRIRTRAFWADLWVRTKAEAHHYKMGFKLLWADIRISSRLLWKVLKGGTLTRRERGQFIRTSSDLFRLVPFSVFIIVPGAELLLPFAIRVFPGLLPSQFQSSKLEKRKGELKVKIEMAKFLTQTLDQMAVEKANAGSEVSEDIKSLSKFLAKNRDSSTDITTDELLKFAKVFNNELTLDNLTRQQLTALCKLLLLQPYGTNNFLRFQLRMKLRQLRADDIMIQKEGVESLSVKELQQACRERGMRALGLTEEAMRSRLKQWLDMQFNDQVPVSLMLLSRILYLPENVPVKDQIKAALSSLPDSIKEEAKVEIIQSEGATVYPEVKLNVLKEQEQLIREEEDEQKRRKVAAKEALRRVEEQRLQEAHAKEQAEAVAGEVNRLAREQMSEGTILPDTAAAEKAVTPVAEKEEEPLTLEELVDLALVIVRASGRTEAEKEKHDVQELKEELVDYMQDVEELAKKAKGEMRPGKGTVRLSRRVERIIGQLERNVAEMLDSTVVPDRRIKLDLDNDGIITTEELTAALQQMDNPPSPEKIKVVAHILDSDSDGVLRVDVIEKVFNLLVAEGRGIQPDALKTIVSLVENEEASKRRQNAAEDMGPPPLPSSSSSSSAPPSSTS